MRHDRLYMDIKHNIEEHGLSVIAVGGSPADFAYSVGLREIYGIELVMEGAPLEVMHRLINDIARAAFDQKWQLAKPSVIQGLLANNFRMALVPTLDSVKSDMTIQAGQYYGDENYDVMQVVFPDVANLFPWEDDYKAMKLVRMLGDMPAADQMLQLATA
jgi:hypothetical protein